MDDHEHDQQAIDEIELLHAIGDEEVLSGQLGRRLKAHLPYLKLLPFPPQDRDDLVAAHEQVIEAVEALRTTTDRLLEARGCYEPEGQHG